MKHGFFSRRKSKKRIKYKKEKLKEKSEEEKKDELINSTFLKILNKKNKGKRKG